MYVFLRVKEAYKLQYKNINMDFTSSNRNFQPIGYTQKLNNSALLGGIKQWRFTK